MTPACLLRATLAIFIDMILKLTPILGFKSMTNAGELRFRLFGGSSHNRKALGKSIALETTQAVFGSEKDLALIRWQ
jgi:hypothetical protein